MNEREPDPIITCLGNGLKWSVWSFEDAPDDWFVSYGDIGMEDENLLGTLSDVGAAVTSLGWLGDNAVVPSHDDAMIQVSYLLALWDVFPLPVLVEMMRMGMSVEDVVAVAGSGVEIDNALLASLMG